jgi:cytidylate kinase
VFLNGADVSEEIRTPAVTAAIKHVADDANIREWMVKCQRQIAHGADIITEGRDQGTVAFPYARCKIYLTATAVERARRRVQDFRDANEQVDYDEVLRQINLRDLQDMARPVGALKKARDAYELLTDRMSLEEVIDNLEEVARLRMAESIEG